MLLSSLEISYVCRRGAGMACCVITGGGGEERVKATLAFGEGRGWSKPVYDREKYEHNIDAMQSLILEDTLSLVVRL